LHHPVIVDPPHSTVDPPEAQCFLDQVVIDRTIKAARFLAIDDPKTLCPIEVRDEPFTPRISAPRRQNLLAIR